MKYQNGQPLLGLVPAGVLDRHSQTNFQASGYSTCRRECGGVLRRVVELHRFNDQGPDGIGLKNGIVRQWAKPGRGTPTCRPALRKRLAVRSDLSSARSGCGYRIAMGEH